MRVNYLLCFRVSLMNLLCYKYSFAKIVIISYIYIISSSFFITYYSFFISFQWHNSIKYLFLVYISVKRKKARCLYCFCRLLYVSLHNYGK